jgi:hypothetical protein
MKISKPLIILVSTFLFYNNGMSLTYTFDKRISNELAWASAFMYYNNSQEYCSKAPTSKEMFQIENDILAKDRLEVSRFFNAMDYNPQDNHISLEEIEGFMNENCSRDSNSKK